tara:strand:- start:502 stop:1098 length:597 start_codon:yes stop_codon:yes gene_type:complete
LVLDNLDEFEEEIDDITIDIGGRKVALEDVERAYGALAQAKDLVSIVTPGRVILATGLVLLLLVSSFGVWYWMIPRDEIVIDTVYMQGGPGHVVLSQIHNHGSREVTNLQVELEFRDMQDGLLGSTTFETSSLPGHVSVAGDDLELAISGASVWENYSISIHLTYNNHRGESVEKTWLHIVGEWTTETFRDEGETHWF